MIFGDASVPVRWPLYRTGVAVCAAAVAIGVAAVAVGVALAGC